MNLRNSLLLSLGFVAAASSLLAAADPFSDLPEKAAPQAVGRRIVENYLGRDIFLSRRGMVQYPEVCAWYGSLTFAQLSGQKDLTQKLIARFQPIFATPVDEACLHDDPNARPPGAPGQGKSKALSQPKGPRLPLVPTQAHVDYRVFGVVPLEIFLQNKEPQYLKLGLLLADAQWKNPTSDGLTVEARYWIDDMYMIPALQVQAFRATKETKYLDRGALTTAAYLDKLQQENGLFLHAPDSPFYWGRGNGWFAAGMAEILRDLPASHPKHARILAGYHKMMSSLLKYQAADGLWRQLVDKPESWTETSGSAMFAFAMVTGVKNGWLDSATYGPAARKAWIALVDQLDEKNNLMEVCIGTNKAQKEVGEDLGKQLAFYLARERKVGDLHGQSPMLWTASALLR